METGIDLKCLIVRSGLKQYQIAQKLNVCPTALNKQLNSLGRLNREEIARIKKAISELKTTNDREKLF